MTDGIGWANFVFVWAAVSNFRLATEDVAINWIIPVAAIAGALLMGAMLTLGKSRKQAEV